MLYLRLPEDRDPNNSTIEIPKWVCAINLSGKSHIQISGLTFRFHKTNQYYHRYWDIEDEDAYVIRGVGIGDGIRVSHNQFDHIVSAVTIVNEDEATKHTGSITISDNSITHSDRDAFRIEGLAKADILRNRIEDTGSRPRRAAHGHTIEGRWITELTVAGNIMQYTYGSAIFLFGGKNNDKSEVPLTRYLVFQNQVSDTCLVTNDWGGIETWQGGPAYMFDNVSLNPGGYWKYLDVISNENWEQKKLEWIRTYTNKDFPFMTQAMSVAGIYNRERRNAYSARFAFPLYTDGAFKQYWFNNIAAGKSSDPTSSLCATGGLQSVAGGFLHSVFNNTFYRLGLGSTKSGTYPAPDIYIANIYENIGDMYFKHQSPKARPNLGAVQIPDDDPSRGDKGSDSYTFMQAYGRNLFYGDPFRFGVVERSGKMYESLDAFRQALGKYHPILASVGETADAPLLADPANGDFRPRPGSPAEDHGALVFVPWGLYGVVGEWHFTKLPEEPNRIVGEHWYMTASHQDRGMYRNLPRHDLEAKGDLGAEDYRFGILEDWTESALSLDGKNQYLQFTHSDMTRDISWKSRKSSGSFPGEKRRTPDMDTNNFLIEVVLKIDPEDAAGGLVSKSDGKNGYRFEINDNGQIMLSLDAGGQDSYTLQTEASLADGKWKHLLVDVDRQKGVTFYIDGAKSSSIIQKGTMPDPSTSLSNQADFIVGKDQNGLFPLIILDFLRIARGNLADARTTIEELYAWQFHGPSRRSWDGKNVTAKSALQK